MSKCEVPVLPDETMTCPDPAWLPKSYNHPGNTGEAAWIAV
jgi:hypothetical protein